ncbi:MAG: hypothetical protein CSYNP_03754 [Syntrophus sp. SKADARSKE-3]|nr:hypothetical protein [Syntrophus sp. SKADARSKE-3]
MPDVIDLSGPAFFSCEKYRCKMSKHDCISRRHAKDKNNIGDWAKYPGCVACDQGAIVEGNIKTETESGATALGTRGDDEIEVAEPAKTEQAVKGPLNDHQTIIKSEAIMGGEKPAIEKEARLCSACKEKPTISDSSPYCASCMAKRGSEKRRQNAVALPKKTRTKKMKKDTCHVEKSLHKENMTVVIDFSAYPSILKQVQDVADDQIRPLESQIIFILKSHFANITL